MKTEEKQKIRQRISKECEKYLLAPENPFTLDNPDVITANGNKLYAIYIPKYSELENLDHLLRRLYLSQLSYGYNMIPVLLVQDEGTRKICDNSAIKQSFAHISMSIDDTIKFINQASPSYRRFKDFSKVQETQYLSYRRILQLSEESHKDYNTKFLPKLSSSQDYVKAKSWSTNNIKENKSFKKTEIGYLATVEKKGQKIDFRKAFEHLMTVAFISRFDYNNGEIYPSKMFDELSVLNTNWTMFDNFVPNAYNHMLSFIGLAPVYISTDNELKDIFYKYQKIHNHVID